MKATRGQVVLIWAGGKWRGRGTLGIGCADVLNAEQSLLGGYTPSREYDAAEIARRFHYTVEDEPPIPATEPGLVM